MPSVPAGGIPALRPVSGFGLLAWRAARPEQARQEMTGLAGLAAGGPGARGPGRPWPPWPGHARALTLAGPRVAGCGREFGGNRKGEEL
jgi:hypothetical protein